ncbi:hypothetical protein ACW7BC_20115 [Azospirillum argentinense]
MKLFPMLTATAACAGLLLGCTAHGAASRSGGGAKDSANEKATADKAKFTFTNKFVDRSGGAYLFTKGSDIYIIGEVSDNSSIVPYLVAYDFYNVTKGTSGRHRAPEKRCKDTNECVSLAAGSEGWEKVEHLMNEGSGRFRTAGSVFNYNYTFKEKFLKINFVDLEEERRQKAQAESSSGVSPTRKTEIKLPTIPYVTTLYYDGKDIYGTSTYEEHVASKYHLLFGLTNEFNKTVSYHNFSYPDGALKYFAKTGSLKKIETIRGSSAGTAVFSDGGTTYDIQYSIGGKGATFQVTNNSNKLSSWRDDLKAARAAGTPDALLQFIDSHPKSPDLDAVRKAVVTDHFNVRVVNSSESPQREVSDKSLMTSTTGACKDIGKTIEISPKRAVPSRAVTLTLSYTLNRTYEPHPIAEAGDPIRKTATYTLNAANGFKVRDTITYDCVLTSGRFHSASLSLLGKLAGVDPKDAGVSTTLTKTSFSLDIDSLR